jgi:hypothetical protein
MKVYLTPYKNAPPFEDYVLLSPQNPFALEHEGIDNGELDSLLMESFRGCRARTCPADLII